MKTNAMGNSIYDTSIRLLVMLLIIVWCLLFIYPFVSIILWSVVLALALYPLHKLLSARIGNRSRPASFIIVFSIMAIVILPTGVLISSLFSEVQELKVAYKNDSLVVPPPDTRVKDWPLVGEKLFDTWNLSSHNRAQSFQ